MPKQNNKEQTCSQCGKPYPVKCASCSDNPEEHTIYVNGYLNTNTPKGYNWLLGR